MNKRRRFIVIGAIGNGLASSLSTERIDLSLNETDVTYVVLDKNIEQERGITINLMPRPINPIKYIINKDINIHSHHKGGKKNKRNKKW